jgi:aminoglycoside phosphotransferase
MHDTLPDAILHLYPQATAIIDIHSYRPGYLPYPARVTLQTAAGHSAVCVVKLSADRDRLAYEAQMLRMLRDLHFPVPEVFGGPTNITLAREPVAILLMSELPGHPLPWIDLTDLATAHRTCQHLLAAVATLHACTAPVLTHPTATQVRTSTLESELQTINAQGGPWCAVPFFQDALELMQTTVPRFPAPLVFSNGDYNPLNVLVHDDVLSGWIDFEHACFEDPHIGFAKFVLWADDRYGWGAGAQAGLVERYVYEQQVASAAFFVRLILRGLHHIQGTDPMHPPRYMVQVVTDTVRRLKQALV